MDAFKYWYYVKPSYFFLFNDNSPFWSKSFCVMTTVIQGDRQALEFAEKSLDLGKVYLRKPCVILVITMNG